MKPQRETSDGQFTEIISACMALLDEQARKWTAKRCAVVGYCAWAGASASISSRATPSVRGFVGYHPSVRDEEPSKLRPRHPNDAVKDFKCPSQIFFGAKTTSPASRCSSG